MSYQHCLHLLFPETIAPFNEQVQSLKSKAGEYWSFFLLVMVLAPLAEEFLFRGLLFRSLDGERGGWKPVLLSTTFFTI